MARGLSLEWGTNSSKGFVQILFGQSLRIVIQAFYFVALARILGVQDYGSFAAIIAISAIVMPFSSLGTNIIMIREVSRDSRTAGAQWARANSLTMINGIIISIIVTCIISYIKISNLDFWITFLIIVSDLIGLKLLELSSTLWQALGSNRQLVLLLPILYVTRCLALLILPLFTADISLSEWSIFYSLTALPLGLGVSLATSLRLQQVKLRISDLKVSRSELKDGAYFSIGAAATTAYNDLDKSMLAKLGTPTAAGEYAAAYKIIDMAYVPVRALAMSNYPKFFAAGETGISGALELAKRQLKLILVLSVLGAVALLLGARFVPILLGEDFSGATIIVYLLAALLPIRAISALAGDILTGSGHQGFRSIVQIGIAIGNFLMNIVLIPPLGVIGAVISTIVCECLIASLLWSRIRTINRLSKQ